MPAGCVSLRGRKGGLGCHKLEIELSCPEKQAPRTGRLPHFKWSVPLGSPWDQPRVDGSFPAQQCEPQGGFSTRTQSPRSPLPLPLPKALCRIIRYKHYNHFKYFTCETTYCIYYNNNKSG